MSKRRREREEEVEEATYVKDRAADRGCRVALISGERERDRERIAIAID